MIRGVSLILGAAVTFALLWVLVTPDTLAALRLALADADWWALAAAFALSAAVQWLRAWRFAMMTGGTPAFPGAPLVRIAFQLNFFNFLLPFRLGELSYPVLMRRAYGQPMLQATGILLLARLFDLCTVGAILLATAALLGLAGSAAASLLLFAAAAGLVLAPGTVALLGPAAQPIIRSMPGLNRLAAPIAAGLEAAGTRRALAAALALSLAIWLAFGLLAVLTTHAVAAGIPALVALLGASAGNLAFALPINGIAGLGPSQAAWVAAVTRAGVGWENAVVSALALYAVTLTSAVLCGGLAMLNGMAADPDIRAETDKIAKTNAG
jgi:uncharacterized membrane protein YbhN (UPF0104 family)